MTIESLVRYSSRVKHRAVGRMTVPCPPVIIYGQDVRYAARGQEARSRDGQDVRYAARGHAYRDVGGRRRLEQAVEAARSRPAKAGIHTSKSRTGGIAGLLGSAAAPPSAALIQYCLSAFIRRRSLAFLRKIKKNRIFSDLCLLIVLIMSIIFIH